MKVITLLFLTLLVLLVSAAPKCWVGSSLYYAAGLYTNEQQFLFQGLQSAGIKVLRVWLDGQNSGSTKNTTIKSFPDLEPYQVGSYDDTVLNLVDDLMITARQYGIKLMISMHSFNALQAGDVYGKRWGTGYFYEQQDAIDAFDNRLRHILTHTHKTLNKQWKDLSEYIFAFEAENEAMIGKGADYIAAHQYWQCDRAATIKSVIGENSGILVTTGGESWLDESMQPDWFNCKALDVLAIHGYGVGDFNTEKLKGYVQKALNAGKKLIWQEWGACYFNTENNDCPAGGVLDPSIRARNIQNWADAIASAGVPWMYWQILPNNDPHDGYDYEIGINDQQWNVFKNVASNTSRYDCAFDFSGYLP
eukprot:TRINITY_DN65_c0_g1_i1.p1 TRINITY_DN65_c0_g1~~TRINITY_DN65_c0_g1_i1.p1  ORF type:complete len:363 (-),score=44.05 TRINITY_DN65_c0_g1_i1:119-1207(-)